MLGTLSAHAAPVEITCRGPFRFHLIEQVATFRDQVDVLRIQPNGPCDHMSCELLSIFFTRPAPHPGAAQPAKQAAPGFDLQPARIEAQGTPTTLTAPMDHLQARAERLQYNLIDGQIYLEDAQEVMLQKDANEIHAPSLRYTPGPPDHTGQFQLLAAGPGWLRGEMADRPGQQLEARWREKLEVRPQDQNQVISLLGGATLNFQAMGRLDARDIHFWLHESPPDAAGQAASFQPDRLLAEGNVVGDSPQFSLQGAVAWKSGSPAAARRRGPAAGVAAARPTHAVCPRGDVGRPLAQGEEHRRRRRSHHLFAAICRCTLPGAQDLAAAGGRQGHLEISGRLLQARVLLQGPASTGN